MDPDNTRQLAPQTIFLMVDGSAHARGAAQLLSVLPLPAGSQIVVVGVLTPGKTPGRDELVAALDSTEALLRGRQWAVRTALLHGHPSAALMDYASRHTPDLVMVGAQGLHTTLGILLGGVAQQIVEYAPWPVLVSRGLYLGFERVLLVTDGSAASAHSVGYLANFPLPERIQINVAHVLPQLQTPYQAGLARSIGERVGQTAEAAAPDDAAPEAAEDGAAIVSAAVAKLAAAGLQAGGMLLRGNAAAEIIHYINTNRVDLVVAGSRGLSPFKGWLLGSVSRKLVHYSGASVLIVKDPLEGQAG